MIDGLKPYSDYEDSRLPWLGEIPSHWEVRRNGRLFVQSNETGFPDLPILEVSLKTGVRVRDMENLARKQVMSDKEKYKRAKQGDIAYNMMRMWQGAVGVAPVDGLISPAYVVAHPLPETDSRYFQYLFRIGSYMNEVNKFSRGIVSDRNRLYWEDFKQMPSPFPPPDEQAAIVPFLDHVDRRVRRYIRAKRQLIALLNEQKQAIIHRAVTRGLDPNVKLKPSGFEWLGDVPKHWDIRRLRHALEMRVSNVDKHTKDNEESVRLCNYVDVYKNEHITNSVEFMAATATPEEVKRFRLEVGDVLITKDSEAWDDIGVPALVMYASADLVCGYHLALFRPLKRLLDGGYLLRVLQSKKIAYQFHVASSGVTRYGLSHEAIKSFRIPLPTLSEQVEISQYLDEATETIESAVVRAESEIVLFREYR